MKLYTDNMPNNCWVCPCFHPDNEEPCRLAPDDDFDTCCYRGDDAPEFAICPLEDIAAHDAKVTKQVCKELVAAVTKKIKQ